MLLIIPFIFFTLNHVSADLLINPNVPNNLTRNAIYQCYQAFKASNSHKYCFKYNILDGIDGGLFGLTTCQYETHCYDKNCNEVYTFLDYTHLKNIKDNTRVCSNGKYGMYNCDRGPLKKDCVKKPPITPPSPPNIEPPNVTPSNCEDLAKCSDAIPQESNLIPDYCDCHRFYQCQPTSGGGWIKYHRDCPRSFLIRDYIGKLYFDSKLKVCSFDLNNIAGICRK